MSRNLSGYRLHLDGPVHSSVSGANRAVGRKDLYSPIREKLEPAAGLSGLFLYIQTMDVPL